MFSGTKLALEPVKHWTVPVDVAL